MKADIENNQKQQKKTYQSPVLTKQGTLEQQTQNGVNGFQLNDAQNSS
jgi:hypothetical protein